MSKKLIIFSLLGISVVFAIITLGLSFSQIKDKYVRVVGMDCNEVPGPYKLYAKGDHGIYYQCGWSGARTAVRLIYLLFFVVVGLLFIFSVLKSPNMMLILTILLALCGALGIFSFIFDVIALNRSKKTCKASYFDNYAGECSNAQFNATCTFSVFTSLAILATAIFSGIFKNSINSQ